VDEIIAKTGESVAAEINKDGVKEKVADSAKFSNLIEFMKCFPLLVKRDKNASQGMNYVMQAQKEQNVSQSKSPNIFPNCSGSSRPQT
jgi:hypothetical protein